MKVRLFIDEDVHLPTFGPVAARDRSLDERATAVSLIDFPANDFLTAGCHATG
jgi:hypothetical protein